MPRHEAGCSFSSEYGMVISGGYDDLTSTEYTLDGDQFESLSEPMPVGKNEHCLVALDGGDLFVTGGYTKQLTFVFTFITMVTTNLDSMCKLTQL